MSFDFDEGSEPLRCPKLAQKKPRKVWRRLTLLQFYGAS